MIIYKSLLDPDFPNEPVCPAPGGGGQGLPQGLMAHLYLGLEVQGLPLVVMKIHR